MRKSARQQKLTGEDRRRLEVSSASLATDLEVSDRPPVRDQFLDSGESFVLPRRILVRERGRRPAKIPGAIVERLLTLAKPGRIPPLPQGLTRRSFEAELLKLVGDQKVSEIHLDTNELELVFSKGGILHIRLSTRGSRCWLEVNGTSLASFKPV